MNYISEQVPLTLMKHLNSLTNDGFISFSNPKMIDFLLMVELIKDIDNERLDLFDGKFEYRYSTDELFKKLFAKYTSPDITDEPNNNSYNLIRIMMHQMFVIESVTFKQFFEEVYSPNVNVYRYVLRMTFFTWPVVAVWLVSHKLAGHLSEMLLVVIKTPLNHIGKTIYEYFKK